MDKQYSDWSPPVRSPEEEERRRKLKEKIRRMKNPSFMRKVWQVWFRPILVFVHRWLWPTKLVHFIWLRTFGRYVFVKRRFGQTSPEVPSMRFIRTHTTIPVPRPLCSMTLGGCFYVFMERIHGEDLQRVDYDTLTETARATLFAELRNYVDQLRALPPPAGSTLISSVLGGPVVDLRLCDDGPYGPYKDEAEMNLQIRHITVDQVEERKMFIPAQIAHLRRVDAIQHKLCFTHGDIAPRNIMVNPSTGHILALVDWESADWFPEHWEYLKAVFGCISRSQWAKDVKRFLDRYDEEVEADMLFIWGRPQSKFALENKDRADRA